MIDIGNPYRKTALLDAFEKVNNAVTSYFDGLSDTDFFMQSENAWSPLENMQHLVLSVQPVAKAIKMPKSVLGMMFGRSQTPSRHYIQLKEIYLDKLVKGATATSRFIPKDNGKKTPPEVQRTKVMEDWRKAAGQLSAALGKWKEEDLDRFLLPHPILGKISVREMLLFTLYHNIHHTISVQKRLEQLAVK